MSRTGNYMEDKGLNRSILLFAVVVAVCYSWQTALAQTESVNGPSGSAGVAGAPQSSTGGVAGQGSGIGGTIAGGVTNGFPNLFRRRLLTRFSVGESYRAGVTDGDRTNSSDFSTSASGALSYNWQGRRSDYGIDYSVAANYYNRLYSLASSVSHSFGVSQTIQLGPRTTWGFTHRFSLTPDYGDELLRDSVVQQFSLANPLPRFGTVDPLSNPNNLPTTINSIPSLNPLPDLGTPSATFVGPPQGTVPFRARRTSNSSQAQLSQALSARTNLSFSAGYDRMRYNDDEYFGSDRVGISASVGRVLSARTSMGLGYFGGRSEQPGEADLTWSHGANLSLSRQLSPRTQVSIAGGPVWVRSEGQETIPLSPVLANLLGQSALSRDSRTTSLMWSGSASLSTQWERTQFGIGYSHGMSSMNALRYASRSDSLSLSLGRQIGRVANISVSASYIRNDFIALQNVSKFDQASGAFNLSRRITSAMDFSLFANYSKLLTSAGATTRATGYQGYGQYGIRVSFHFPRVSE